MDTITDILARPGEAARQLSEMRAALEEVTARLAAVTEERNQWRRVCLAQDRIGIKRALSARKVAQAYRQLDAEASEWMLKALKQAAETGTARAEVARVTELAITERDSAAREIARLTAALHVYERMNNTDLLRGDTAPARGEVAGELAKIKLAADAHEAARLRDETTKLAPAGGKARP